jgi:hypothetical protein
MVKVTDILPNHPIADECRRILGLDLDEQDIATAVQVFTAEMQHRQEEWLEAWDCLSSWDRSSWKRYVDYDLWLAAEKERARNG